MSSKVESLNSALTEAMATIRQQQLEIEHLKSGKGPLEFKYWHDRSFDFDMDAFTDKHGLPRVNWDDQHNIEESNR